MSSSGELRACVLPARENYFVILPANRFFLNKLELLLRFKQSNDPLMSSGDGTLRCYAFAYLWLSLSQ